MKVQSIPLDSIKPYWRNPRKNEQAVAAVMRSIQEYGFNQPIVIDTKNVIIVGHTRYKALRELGYKEAPCVIADLPPAKAKEYRIADNKTAEMAEWDIDAMIQELREIERTDVMQEFFHDADIQELLQETATVAEVTADQIKAQAQKLETRFEDISKKAQGSYIEVICPSCGEQFFVNRQDALSRPGTDAPDTRSAA